MATVAECEKALHQLAERFTGAGDDTRRKVAFDRTLSCRLTDLDMIFGGRLQDGSLSDIRQVSDPTAQVRLTMASDDLLALVDGRLAMATAWATGRLKLDASVLDLLRLRTMF